MLSNMSCISAKPKFVWNKNTTKYFNKDEIKPKLLIDGDKFL